MTGNNHNREGNSGEEREPDPGPYWRRMHRDPRFWVGALFDGSRDRYLCNERGPCVDTEQSASTCACGNFEVKRYRIQWQPLAESGG